ncbi:DinB family protein [Jeotgalibacillus proteolyticus]|uniref:DinB family protein n=1 Tax=Jeotgalibacillus proteolyticus TaxID=2082395 RepID=A0A2S5GDU2_9BACL|nr:DinB family protein [Jeotgalibacillus proteolyticus]PPA71085.1 DinB family protein [Jeotgalibacillus proteolyticus]
MNTKEILVDQLDATLENTWFVSLKNSIDGLTEEQANWKAYEATNSIFEIVNHLMYYNERCLKRFKGNSVEPNDHSDTFRNREGLSWEAAAAKLNDMMLEWKNAVVETDSSHLDEEKAGDIPYLTIHTAYHTGQILFIRKLQGSWDSESGVQG